MLMVAVLAAAPGCGGDDDTDDTTTTTTSSTTTTTSTSTTSTTIEPIELFIEIDFPRPGQEFSTRNVTFRGRATPGATVTAGLFSTTADDIQRWSLSLPLGPEVGPVDVTVRATDDDGAEVERTIRIVYSPAVTSTTQEPSF